MHQVINEQLPYFLVYKSTFYDQTKNNQSDFKAFLK